MSNEIIDLTISATETTGMAPFTTSFNASFNWSETGCLLFDYETEQLLYDDITGQLLYKG